MEKNDILKGQDPGCSKATDFDECYGLVESRTSTAAEVEFHALHRIMA